MSSRRTHPDTLHTENVIRNITRNEAYERGDRALLEDLRARLGPQHPDTLDAMRGLAKTIAGEGRLAEAEKLQREILEVERGAFGLEDDLSLATMGDLVETLSAENSLAEAEKVQREVLEIERRAHGPSWQGLPGAEYELAALLARERKRTEALSLLAEAVKQLDANAALAMSDDPNFSSLHGDPRFEATVADAKRLQAPSH